METFRITTAHTDLAYHRWHLPSVSGAAPTQWIRGAGWFVLQCDNPDCEGQALVPVSVATDHADQLDPAVEAQP